MMAAASVPYEKQSDQQSSRTCGAACLSMAYRSFGKEVPQAEIWPVIAKENRSGHVASTTHLMVRDALNRGFAAVAVQARHPLQILRLCRDSGARAILNHRLRRDTPAGHYSVFVHIDDQSVILHDPLLGPSRRLTFAELLELWLPHFPDSEIAGNVLIAVSPPPAASRACPFCRTPVPASVACPRCKEPVGLQPDAVLGCVNDACIARMWNYICCPSCDCLWSLKVPPPPPSSTKAGESAAANVAAPPVAGHAQGSHPEGLNLSKLFGELDKFTNHILSVPAAAAHPEIKKQLDFIAASKEKLTLICAEQAAGSSMRQHKLSAVARKLRESEEAQRKQTEEASKPSAPLDGDALGKALLKNLGFR